MRLGSGIAWLLALLIGSLAGVLMSTSLPVPHPTEVRPIRVWPDSRAGDHVAESGIKLEGEVSELGRAVATPQGSGDGSGHPDRDGGGNAVDADRDEQVGDVSDRADDSGAEGAAPAPDDALDPDDVQGGGGDNDEPRDGDGGGGD